MKNSGRNPMTFQFLVGVYLPRPSCRPPQSQTRGGAPAPQPRYITLTPCVGGEQARGTPRGCRWGITVPSYPASRSYGGFGGSRRRPNVSRPDDRTLKHGVSDRSPHGQPRSTSGQHRDHTDPTVTPEGFMGPHGACDRRATALTRPSTSMC